MRETANLHPFTHLKEERQVLQQHSYVDDILTSHDNLDHLTTITANVEWVLNAGGFKLKPWVFPGQSGWRGCCDKLEETAKTVILPNQMRDEDTRRLA